MALLVILLSVSLSTAATAARPLSHFPVQVDGVVQGSVAVVDITSDGRGEIVAAAGPVVTALRADNSLVSGFPVYLGAEAAGAVAVGDVLGEGEMAALVVTRDGGVHLLRADGSPWPGFPVSVGEGARAGGALLDVTRDGTLEVVAGGADGRVHAWSLSEHGPTLLPGFPIELGAEVTSTPSLSDLGGLEEAEPTLLVGASDGGLHAFDVRGGGREGFPVRSRFLVSGQPASADISDDGVADVVFTSQDYRLYAVDAAGRALPGFPFETGYRIYGGPALADLTGDGVPEVAFAASDRKLYVVDGEAEPLPGFPVELSANPVGSVVVGDLHRNGTDVLVVATEDRRVNAFDAVGNALDGWPISIDAAPSGPPTLADLAGDGYVELIVGTRDSRVVGLKSRRKGEEPMRLSWSTGGHDAARSGWRHPNSARFYDVKVVPDEPRSIDAIASTWTWRHLDRVPEGEVSVRWYRGHEEIEDLRDERSVPAELLAKGELWRFTVEAGDEGEGARTFESAAVRIRNAPPTRPAVRIAPLEPRVGATLEARIEEPSTDPDDDEVRYRYLWLRDDEAFDLPRSASFVPAGTVRKGEVWQVVVTPFDGEEEGPASDAMVTVLNTPPTRPMISLRPKNPKVTDEIAVRIDEPATDADGDDLTMRYRWRIDDEPAAFAESVAALPPGTVRKGQTVSVAACAFDGEEEGPTGESSVTVRNTAPTAPDVVIEPSTPRTNDVLHALVRTPAHDPDGDPIRYTYRWSLDGEDAKIHEDEVGADLVEAGQSWSVTVQAHDDEVSGGETTTEVEVVNTPPEPPVVTIGPDDPLPEQPLEVVMLSPPSDRDGDEISLTFTFSAEGRESVEGEEVPAGLTRKGEVWTLTVVPHDGSEAGEPAVASVEIGNRPPPTPTVRLEPTRPTGGTAIQAIAPIPEDPDGDTVTLRVKWTVDGRPVPELDDRLEVPVERVARDQVWTVRVAATDGEDWSGVASDTVKVLRRPPAPPALVVTPDSPGTTDEIRCETRRPASHPDGDPFDLDLVWYRDGVQTSNAGEILSADATRRGERWTCAGRVTALSGTVLGEKADEVLVANSPPAQPKVSVFPEQPRRDDGLHCGLERPSLDVDGDPIVYDWAWTRNDEAVGDVDGPVVEEGRVRRGQRWTCTATPRDPYALGESARATVEVVNTPPTAPVVAIVPDEAEEGDDLRCEVLEPAVDPDGGDVSYRFRWYRNGELQLFAPTSTAVRGRLVEAGCVWRCGATADDGTDEGPEGRSSAVEIRRPEPGPAVSGATP